MFNIKPNTELKNFKKDGLAFSSDAGSLKISRIDGQASSPVYFDNGNGEQYFYIQNQNISELIFHGIFNQGVYNKEVVLVKEGSNILAIPIDTETYNTLISRDLPVLKLITGHTYDMEIIQSYGYSVGRQSMTYLGSWNTYLSRQYWGTNVKKTSSMYFRSNLNGNIYSFKQKRHFLLHTLLDNTVITDNSVFERDILIATRCNRSAPTRRFLEVLSNGIIEDLSIDNLFQIATRQSEIV